MAAMRAIEAVRAITVITATVGIVIMMVVTMVVISARVVAHHRATVIARAIVAGIVVAGIIGIVSCRRATCKEKRYQRQGKKNGFHNDDGVGRGIITSFYKIGPIQPLAMNPKY